MRFADPEILHIAAKVVKRPHTVHRQLQAVVATPITRTELPVNHYDTRVICKREIDLSTHWTRKTSQPKRLLDQGCCCYPRPSECFVLASGRKYGERMRHALLRLLAKLVGVGLAIVILAQQYLRIWPRIRTTVRIRL